MQYDKIFIAMDAQAFKEVLNEVLDERFGVKENPEFEGDRISKPQAAKLADISIPTLSKQVKLGKFKQYHIGSRVYFLRSEVIEALKTQ